MKLQQNENCIPIRIATLKTAEDAKCTWRCGHGSSRSLTLVAFWECSRKDSRAVCTKLNPGITRLNLPSDALCSSVMYTGQFNKICASVPITITGRVIHRYTQDCGCHSGLFTHGTESACLGWDCIRECTFSFVEGQGRKMQSLELGTLQMWRWWLSYSYISGIKHLYHSDL